MRVHRAPVAMTTRWCSSSRMSVTDSWLPDTGHVGQALQLTEAPVEHSAHVARPAASFQTQPPAKMIRSFRK